MLHINGSLHNTSVLPLGRYFQGKENVLICICLCISLRQMSYKIRLGHNMEKKNWSLETTKRKEFTLKPNPMKVINPVKPLLSLSQKCHKRIYIEEKSYKYKQCASGASVDSEKCLYSHLLDSVRTLLICRQQHFCCICCHGTQHGTTSLSHASHSRALNKRVFSLRTDPSLLLTSHHSQGLLLPINPLTWHLKLGVICPGFCLPLLTNMKK